MLLINRKGESEFLFHWGIIAARKGNILYKTGKKGVSDAEKWEIEGDGVVLLSLPCDPSGAGFRGDPRDSVTRQSTHHCSKPSAAACSPGCPWKNSLPPTGPSAAARSATWRGRGPPRSARGSSLWHLCRESRPLPPAAFAHIPHDPTWSNQLP